MVMVLDDRVIGGVRLIISFSFVSFIIKDLSFHGRSVIEMMIAIIRRRELEKNFSLEANEAI
jgi:hypothetical protein